jgi:hypothetical protein
MLKVIGASWFQTRVSTCIVGAVSALGILAVILGEIDRWVQATATCWCASEACITPGKLWGMRTVDGTWYEWVTWKTNSMEQSPSWEGDNCSARQEIVRLSWNTVLYRVHKSPPIPRPCASFRNLLRILLWGVSHEPNLQTGGRPLTQYIRIYSQYLGASPACRELPVVYGTRRFITVFTKARHQSLPRALWIQSTPLNPIYLTSF